MSVIDVCRFGTDRLEVAPWHEVSSDEGLPGFVVGLLTPAVTVTLPPDWGGRYDHERATNWIRQRDAESTVLLVQERSPGTPAGLLIVTANDDARPPLDLRIGYLVVEDRWGRGLGSELVGGFVAWCRSLGAVRSISGGVDRDNVASASVLAKHGFIPTGAAIGGEEQTYRLIVLPDLEFTIRPENPGDHGAIREVVNSAFGSGVEADLVERIRASPEYVPDLALVAEADGEVIGHVMISGATVRHESGERSIVMLSPLAVEPGHQRRGVGAALVEAAVAGAEARGEPLVVLEGSPAYYSRFGFVSAVAHGLIVPLPDWAPPEAGQVRLLSSHDPADPTRRGAVVYPAAFDGLAD